MSAVLADQLTFQAILKLIDKALRYVKKRLIKSYAGSAMKKCYSCLKVMEIRSPVSRQDTCAFCNADLRCCLNCGFYAPGSYNECREPQAERITEKHKSNYCDFFVFRDSKSDENKQDTKEAAKAKLNSLFKDL